MQRVVGLIALIICACLLAGCGGSSLQAKARKVVGDPHATVVSTETVDPLGGGRLAVVVMKPGGSQGLGCGNNLMGGPTRCPHWSDAYVRLGATTHADMGDLGISKWQVAAIARARATDFRFAVFPIVNQLTVRCGVGIPHLTPSGHGGQIRGMCATIALPFGGPVLCVAFITGWRPTAGDKMKTAAWVVRFDRNGRIKSTCKVADPPPPWNGHQPQTCSEIV
jgi:hypothetical protein